MPIIELGDDGELILKRLPPVYGELLSQVPVILQLGTDPTVYESLFGDSFPGDPKAQEEWDRFETPELFALLASQTDIVESDLRGLTVEPGGEGMELTIPASHRNAWMAALNATRLMLADQYEIGEADMNRELELDEPDEREIALLKIHLLADVQSLIVDAGSPND
jgi:hypothetical protein